MSDSKDPPRLPDVVDEAGPSPRWLPWLGIGLFCLVAGLIAARQVVGARAGDAQSAEVAAGGDQGAAGAGAQQPLEAKKQEPAAAAQH